MLIQDLSPEQRPRERLLAGRGEELADAELLALLWGSGQRGKSAVDLAQGALAQSGGLNGLLGLGLQDWIALPGLGPARACQLWAAAELARRGNRSSERPRLSSPRAAAAPTCCPAAKAGPRSASASSPSMPRPNCWRSASLARAPPQPPSSAPGNSSGKPYASAPPRPWPSTITPAGIPAPAPRTPS